MMVFGVLVLLFGSFLQPITILFSLPLSIGGAILALLITHKPISDAGRDRHPDADGHRHQERHHAGRFRGRGDGARRRPRHEAIVEAGRKRARPIVMTTIAMAAGMVPVGAGARRRRRVPSPMAIAVIGGLIMSTLLSLVFVPAVFIGDGRPLEPRLALVRPVRRTEGRTGRRGSHRHASRQPCRSLSAGPDEDRRRMRRGTPARALGIASAVMLLLRATGLSS